MRSGSYVTPNLRLVDELGEGGMGSVWVAENESLGMRVAVKFISTELIDKDPSILERFQREASLAAQIKSPHVVQTYDHGVMEDGQPYIVMELLEGEALAERLEGEPQLPLEVVVDVVEQTARGLGRAHKEHIVHRDIKPDNIFLVEDDDRPFHIKILDFGIAKQTAMPTVTNMTGTNMMIGTPEYMSPEQVLSAKNVDEGTDLWSLAVVAYRCITGTTPFDGETLGALSVAITSAKFVPPSELRPGLPTSVDGWFARALHRDAPERFASARELAETFAGAVGGATVPSSPGAFRSEESHAATIAGPTAAARSMTFGGTTVSASRRRRTRTMLVAATLAGAVAATAVTAALVGDNRTGEQPSSAATTPSSLPEAETEAEAEAEAETETEAEAETEAETETEAGGASAGIARPPVSPVVPERPHASPRIPPPPPTVKDRGF